MHRSLDRPLEQASVEGRIGKRIEKEMSDLQLAKDALDFFDLLAETFPPLKALELGQIVPKQLRETSLVGSPLMMRILAGVYHSLTTEHAWTHEMVKDYFAALATHMVGPAHANSIWRLHLPDHIFDEGALAPNGRRQDSAALNRALIEWAIDKEPFVYEAPQPAPEPEVDPDEGIDFAPDHDTKKLDVEVRNEFEDISVEHKAKAKRATSRARSKTE